MSSATGFLWAACAAVAFGVQYVPVKKYPIYDGATFQWFMCSGILMMGFVIALAFGDVERGMPLPVIFGGCLWALSNYFVIPLVNLLGIGLGFSLYHFVNLTIGYAVGRFGLFGVEKSGGNLPLCDLGCVFILVSFVGMVFVENSAEEPRVDQREADPVVQAPRRNTSFGAFSICSSDAGGEAQNVEGGSFMAPLNSHTSRGDIERPTAPEHRSGADGVTAAGEGEPSSESVPAGGRWARKLLGVLLALVGGGFCGVQSVPATLYNAAHKDIPASAVVLPQCFGIWVASAGIYTLYASVARLSGWPVPHSVIRPAYFSGCIWAIGFATMIAGIDELGFSVGYTLDAVGPIVVSSFLSIVVFREITEKKQLVLYAAAFTLQLIGVLLIAIFGKAAE